jgi:hypothetical protein
MQRGTCTLDIDNDVLLNQVLIGWYEEELLLQRANHSSQQAGSTTPP